MLTFLGALLLIFAVAAIFLPSDSPVGKITRGGKRKLILALAGIAMILSDGFFFYAKPGTAYAVQYLWGGDQAVTSQGLKTKAWGRLIPISFEIPIQDTIGAVEEEEGIYYQRATLREFSDAIKADIATSLIIGVNYENEEQFLNMADRNRSEGKLVHARIIPVYDQALKNTCKLMSAQEYISGASAQFDFWLRDQLENGMYMTEEVDNDSPRMSQIGDSAVVRQVQAQDPVSSFEKKKEYRIKRNSAGEPMRDTSNSLKKYGLTVIQAAVTDIDWERSFDARLDAQKEQVAATQLEKEEAQKEFYATQKAIQKGERLKAEEQAKLEKEQLTKTIAAETEAKAAKFKEEEEKNLLAAARLEKERIKVLAEAEYYKNQKLVAAGLTPQERKAMDIQMNKDKWGAISTMKFDGVYINGEQSAGGGEGILTQLLGAEVAKGMKK